MTTARAPRTRLRITLLILAGLAFVAVILIATLQRPGGAPNTGAPTTQSAPGGSPTTAAGEQTEQTEQSEPQRPQVPDMARRIDGDVAALGAVDAPVVLIEYADYRCPYCGVFAQQTLPQLVSEYVDAGDLRIEWRDTPIFGDDSFRAAIAARAAGAQGLFWEYNHAVYAFQGEGRKDLPRAQLIAFAREVGVPDMAAFEAALDDPALVEGLHEDSQEAQWLGVQSTPTFLIGQTPVMGAQPVEYFRQVIDAELARAGK